MSIHGCHKIKVSKFYKSQATVLQGYLQLPGTHGICFNDSPVQYQTLTQWVPGDTSGSHCGHNPISSNQKLLPTKVVFYNSVIDKNHHLPVSKHLCGFAHIESTSTAATSQYLALGWDSFEFSQPLYIRSHSLCTVQCLRLQTNQLKTYQYALEKLCQIKY